MGKFTGPWSPFFKGLPWSFNPFAKCSGVFMAEIIMTLTNRFDPDVRVFKEARYLVQKGNQVTVLCWDRNLEYPDQEDQWIDGVHIKRFYYYSQYGTGMKQLKSFLRFRSACRRYLREKTFDAIHGHDLDGMIIGAHLLRPGVRLTFDMHEIYEINAGSSFYRKIVRLLVHHYQNKADAIIYVNPLQKDLARERNFPKFHYLPNFPSLEDYQGAYPRIRRDKDPLKVGYIGSVRQEEELKNLILSAENLKDVEIFIHGAGTSYEPLRTFAENRPGVHVTGVYHYSDSVRLYNGIDLLYVLYPKSVLQYAQTYPIKFFEGILTLTPMVVGRGTVLEKIVKEKGIGFAVDGEDREEISALLVQLRDRPEILNQCVENLKKIQYEYSWDQVVSVLSQIYPPKGPFHEE